MALSQHLLLTLFFTYSTTLLASISHDKTSLLDLKKHISDDPFGLLTNWKQNTHHCRWYGITCDSLSGRVFAVNITGNITGFLVGSVGDLSQLRVLSIPDNVFSGEIPVEVGNLRLLRVLELQRNNFSGVIPNSIRYMSALVIVNLSNNSLSGQIPDGLIGFGSLSEIDLSNNGFGGGLLIAVKCLFLIHLKLSNNFFVDGIPGEIGKCLNLRTLLLDGNIFQGHIPGEIGRLLELRVLDVSRNSLTDEIPKELGNCLKLSVLVLTNLVDFSEDEDSSVGIFRGEFNAFEGGIPYEIFSLPNLRILWAPRGNFGGQLPSYWTESCSLRVLNLAHNKFTGLLHKSIVVMCKNITFLDLSDNTLQGELPLQLPVPCILYFNVSGNLLSGLLPRFSNTSCGIGLNSYSEFFDEENIIQQSYSGKPIWIEQIIVDNFVVAHDFSWNSFVGPLSSFSIGNEFLAKGVILYRLFLNNNNFTGSLPSNLFPGCNDIHNFSISLSSNRISGKIYPELLHNCLKLTELEAADNLVEGSLPAEIGSLKMLRRLDLSKNRLSGSLPDQLGELKDLEGILLGENNLTGIIPHQLGHLTSLKILNLSQNSMTGLIPLTLENASNLEMLLLDHNTLSGEIPLFFSNLSHLTQLDLSFNNLSGHIPHFQNFSDCRSFRGNKFLNACPDRYSMPPASDSVQLAVHKSHNKRKLRTFVIAMGSSASFVLLILVVVFLVFLLGRRKLSRITSLRIKGLVTFADTPVELNYDNVVGATGNFSISNLIGAGGFGSTYRAELAPGFLLAVKRLSIGRFQGIQQFDAEIRTLGRLQHKNLVTLIGYYVGEEEMFLVYNYLSGGNLETFIHEKSGSLVKWPVIYKIAIHIADALAFLHNSCVPRIVHRDIKPSNILLDEELNAYISDFGLARLLEVSETHATTNVAGKKSLDPSFSNYGNGFNIVGWARLLIKEGRPSEFFSLELWASGPHESLLGMLRLAAACTVESLRVRPTMKQVLDKLKQLQP
ncbi:LRR receptor-like serine/threonine-protein kinase RPK2 [Heracleum sosnowskyi]|uniref:non-specific serine/threonine protein kinase n=1 Tax=Heracleum sosnowskyi TaxID=360622 RepID=A0AAD8HMB4_9APIA|nr:LRR receptor-like serine/threonine-protein kinase RPK2 [Heracleum sosnowskyi]